MKKKGISIFISLVILLPMLSGCKDNTKEMQVAAVEKAIEDFKNETDEFCVFEYSDLEEQIEALYEKKSDTTEYEIKINIPDISKMDIEKILVDVPVYDLNNVDLQAFASEFTQNARKTVENQVSDTKIVSQKDSKLLVYLKKIDKEWFASVDKKEVSSLCQTFADEMDQKAVELLDLSEDYKKLKVADTLDDKLVSLFVNEEYSRAVHIDDIQLSDNNYTISISYPDPQQVYSSIFEPISASYTTNGQHLFDPVTTFEIEFLTDSDDLVTAVQSADSIINGSFTILSDGTVDADADVISTSLFDIRSQNINNCVDTINAACLIPSLDPPETGMLIGENSGQSLQIKTNSDLEDVHVTFYKISDSDDVDDDVVFRSVYIHAGDSFTIRLPVGDYIYIVGSGDTWYGNDYSFGSGGFYHSSDSTINIQRNYTYTLTLGNATDGNVPSSNIPYPY